MVPLLFYAWVCSGEKATYRSEINIFFLLWSFTVSNNETILFPIEDGLCPANQTELCLPGDWRQLCWCWATNQTELLRLWSLNNSWITRALSQKTPCLFLQTWAIKWLCLWNQLPNLCFTGMCLSLDSREFPTWGESRFPIIDPSITWKTITTVLQIPCVISVGTDSTMLRKTNWTREGGCCFDLQFSQTRRLLQTQMGGEFPRNAE